MKKQIRRTPIVLNKNTVALLHIFTRHDSMDDIWMHDIAPYIEENYQEHAKSAKELIKQLEDHYSIAFLEALIVECLNRIKSSDKEFNTHHFISTSQRLELLLKRERKNA